MECFCTFYPGSYKLDNGTSVSLNKTTSLLNKLVISLDSHTFSDVQVTCRFNGDHTYNYDLTF